MRLLLRLCGLLPAVGLAAGRRGRSPLPPRSRRIDIKHVGPPAASDDLIRANIRVKAGDPYLRGGGG